MNYETGVKKSERISHIIFSEHYLLLNDFIIKNRIINLRRIGNEFFECICFPFSCS